MISKFNSTCPHCGQSIKKDVDTIAKKAGKWGHAICPRESGQPFVSNVVSAAVEATSFIPSRYQQGVFDFITSGQGHAVVSAVAGSGKTTTIVQALKLTPPDAKVVFLAFNKHIANELAKKSPPHVKVCTLHSLGLAALRQRGRIKIDEYKLDNIIDEFLPIDRDEPRDVIAALYSLRNNLKKLVSLVKATLCDSSDGAAIQQTADHYGLELNGDEEAIIGLLPQVLARCAVDDHTVDFDDMIWLPVHLGLPLEKFDWVFVDECQDLNKSQIELVLRSIAEGGRVVAVGDASQSLYGFRGADTEAIGNIVAALDAVTLPLSITYRCPLSHVRLAQTIVPHLEAGPNAIEGIVENVSEDGVAERAKDGDMIICRVNAPLISLAFKLIRKGIKAVVRGRDIGKNLSDLIRKFNADSIDDLCFKIDEYVRRESLRLARRRDRESLQIQLDDKVDTLRAVISDCATVPDVLYRLESLFSDDIEGVVLSSVHRAKGLEANRVFILRPDLLPHPKAQSVWQVEQENNCRYVALTRSKSELFFVSQ